MHIKYVKDSVLDTSNHLPDIRGLKQIQRQRETESSPDHDLHSQLQQDPCPERLRYLTSPRRYDSIHLPPCQQRLLTMSRRLLLLLPHHNPNTPQLRRYLGATPPPPLPMAFHVRHRPPRRSDSRRYIRHIHSPCHLRTTSTPRKLGCAWRRVGGGEHADAVDCGGGNGELLAVDIVSDSAYEYCVVCA